MPFDIAASETRGKKTKCALNHFSQHWHRHQQYQNFYQHICTHGAKLYVRVFVMLHIGAYEKVYRNAADIIMREQLGFYVNEFECELSGNWKE